MTKTSKVSINDNVIAPIQLTADALFLQLSPSEMVDSFCDSEYNNSVSTQKLESAQRVSAHQVTMYFTHVCGLKFWRLKGKNGLQMEAMKVSLKNGLIAMKQRLDKINPLGVNLGKYTFEEAKKNANSVWSRICTDAEVEAKKELAKKVKADKDKNKKDPQRIIEALGGMIKILCDDVTDMEAQEYKQIWEAQYKSLSGEIYG